MEALAIVIIAALGVISGSLMLFAYMVIRMTQSDNWDHSNLTNAMRVLSHVIMHPEDLGKLYYLSDTEFDELTEVDKRMFDGLRRPFWYIDRDELSEVVKTRP